MKRMLVASAVVSAAVSVAVIVACSSGSSEDPGSGGTSTGNQSPVPEGGVATDGGDHQTDPPPAGEDAAPPPEPPKVNVTNETVMVDGEARSYVLAVPVAYDANVAYPLVLVLHGDGGDGASMRALHTFDAVSAEHAIVAYPSGRNATWNHSLDVDGNPEMRFLRELVAALRLKYNVDAARVFGTGYSSGAFMINQVACRTGLFRALVPYAGGAPYNPPNEGDPNAAPDCSSGTAVATMVVQGAADPEVLPSSGRYCAEYWRQRNGCQSSQSPVDPAPCVAFDGCPGERPVRYCEIPGLGHIPWSEGARAAWTFFQALPR